MSRRAKKTSQKQTRTPQPDPQAAREAAARRVHIPSVTLVGQRLKEMRNATTLIMQATAGDSWDIDGTYRVPLFEAIHKLTLDMFDHCYFLEQLGDGFLSLGAPTDDERDEVREAEERRALILAGVPPLDGEA